MSDYHKYVGVPYDAGKNDCYSIGRRYFLDTYGLRLRNYARPERFWEDPDLDLYQYYRREGFQPVFDQPYEIGDVLLMPLMTPIATHACIIVDDNLILHHPPGQLSRLDNLHPKWSGRATIHIRHPGVSAKNQQLVEKVHLHEIIDTELFRHPDFQEAVAKAMGSTG